MRRVRQAGEMIHRRTQRGEAATKSSSVFALASGPKGKNSAWREFVFMLTLSAGNKNTEEFEQKIAEITKRILRENCRY
jgi:hypothetical protein